MKGIPLETLHQAPLEEPNEPTFVRPTAAKVETDLAFLDALSKDGEE